MEVQRVASLQPSTASLQPSTTSPAAAETEVQRGASLQSAQQPGAEPAVATSQTTKKKSFLKVIDHQNQPASQSAGREPPIYSGQPPLERRDLVSQSRTGDLDYHNPVATVAYQRFESGEDTRRAVPLDSADLLSRLDATRDGRYGGLSTSSGAHYYRPGGDRREFWNQLSAYCDEYEARMGRRDDVGDVGSRLPRPTLADYSRDFNRLRAGECSMLEQRGDVGNRPLPSDYSRDFNRLRAGESSMLEQRGDVGNRPLPSDYSSDFDRPRTRENLLPERRGDVDIGGGARYRAAEEMDDRERLQRYAERVRGPYWSSR